MPEPASAVDVADVVTASLARARGTTPPPHQDPEISGVGGALASDLAGPPSERHVRAEVLDLPGAHRGSPAIVYRYASQVTALEFTEILMSVEGSVAEGTVRSPVAVLVAALRRAVESAHREQAAAQAADAAVRFGYTEEAPSDRLRANPEEWVRQVAPTLPATELEAWLADHVADELERRRLAKLAEELRAA